jgi:hypothetical protein
VPPLLKREGSCGGIFVVGGCDYPSLALALLRVLFHYCPSGDFFRPFSVLAGFCAFSLMCSYWRCSILLAPLNFFPWGMSSPPFGQCEILRCAGIEGISGSATSSYSAPAAGCINAARFTTLDALAGALAFAKEFVFSGSASGSCLQQRRAMRKYFAELSAKNDAVTLVLLC